MTARESLQEIINSLSVGYAEELLESAETLHGEAQYWDFMEELPENVPQNWEGMNVKKKLRYLINELFEDNLKNLLDYAQELHLHESQDLLETFHTTY